MKSDEKKYEDLEKLRKVEKSEADDGWLKVITTEPPTELPAEPKTEVVFEEKKKSEDWPEYEELQPKAVQTDKPVPVEIETTKMPVTEEPEENYEKGRVGEDGIVPDGESLTEEENSSKKKFSKGTLNPTDAPPATSSENEGLPELENPKHPQKQKREHGYFKNLKSPAAFAAVIGLSCGSLVIILGTIIALVMRKNRGTQSHVYIPDTEPEDQEHLVKMQKTGYENPTYKFFYY